MPITDLYDRKEGYGHTAGSSTLKDDGSTASITPPSFNDDTTSERLALSVATPNATSRKYGVPDQASDLFDRESGYGHTAGDPDDSMSADTDANSNALAFTGSNSALTTSSTDASASYRTAAAPDADMRAQIGFADRSTGWGHTAATDADLDDA